MLIACNDEIRMLGRQKVCNLFCQAAGKSKKPGTFKYRAFLLLENYAPISARSAYLRTTVLLQTRRLQHKANGSSACNVANVCNIAGETLPST